MFVCARVYVLQSTRFYFLIVTIFRGIFYDQSLRISGKYHIARAMSVIATNVGLHRVNWLLSVWLVRGLWDI
jgi:hypothetical protein